MRAPFVLLIALGLAACDTSVPDSGAGVGFTDYNTYLRAREAQLAGRPLAAPVAPLNAAPVAPVATTGFSVDRVGAAIDAADGRAQVAAAPLPAPTPIFDPNATNLPLGNAPLDTQVATQNSTGISDEQDFAAVSARETIESDKERRARQQAQYQVIAPTALPQRTGQSEPNIVQFAISTTHAPGTPVYKRSSLRVTNEAKACSQFISADLAQEAFLAAGGPERDRKGLDQDGDGFACGWDPRPFRAAIQ